MGGTGGGGMTKAPQGLYLGEALRAQLPHADVCGDMSSWELKNSHVIAPEVSRAVAACSFLRKSSLLGAGKRVIYMILGGGIALAMLLGCD